MDTKIAYSDLEDRGSPVLPAQRRPSAFSWGQALIAIALLLNAACLARIGSALVQLQPAATFVSSRSAQLDAALKVSDAANRLLDYGESANAQRVTTGRGDDAAPPRDSGLGRRETRFRKSHAHTCRGDDAATTRRRFVPRERV